jgi:hypothetical protein
MIGCSTKDKELKAAGSIRCSINPSQEASRRGLAKSSLLPAET